MYKVYLLAAFSLAFWTSTEGGGTVDEEVAASDGVGEGVAVEPVVFLIFFDFEASPFSDFLINL